MPTYQYACTEAECGHVFEQFQSFTEESLTTCPQCEGRLRKVFNAVGVVFKGSGFYRTDSRSSGGDAKGEKSGATGSGEGSAPATAGSSAGSSDSSGGAKSSGSASTTATAGAGAA